MENVTLHYQLYITMKKLLTLFAFALVTFTANAQAYQYNCELGGDDNVKLYTCTTEKIDNVSNLPLYLGLSCNYKITCILSLKTFSFRKQYHKEKKKYSIQIKLSNGDVLSSFNCGCNMAYLWYENMRSFKVNNISKDKYGAYSMSLLRTYDIVSITIDDITINTPGLRSSDTFDAMCKTLISKTGDQGQYGKRLTNNNTTTNTQAAPTYVTKRIAIPNAKTVVTTARGAKVTKTKLDFVPNQVFDGNNVITCNLNIEFVGEYKHDYRPFVYLYKDNKGTPLKINGQQVYSFTDQTSYYKNDGSFAYYGFDHNYASLPIYYKELDPNINTFYARLWLYDETDKKYIGCSDYYAFTRNGNSSVVPSKNNSNTASNAQKPQTPRTSKPSTNRTQQNSQKPNTSKSSSKPNSSNSQSNTNNVDLSKSSAKTLKAEAENYNPDAMYLLGCRYHDGQLPGIEKNDRLSYQWLMTYCHVSNEKDGEKALDYIKNNLKRNNSTLKPSYEYLTKETNLTPMDFILHPLAYFPTSAIFMKEANMEREIATKKQMRIYTSIKKKYDKGEIKIRESDNIGEMPKLIKKEVWSMDWRSKNTKYTNYTYDFKFGNRNEAEKFLYTIAYETMQEDVFWEKNGFKTPRKIDENVALSCSSYLTINGKRYNVQLRLYLFDNKSAKPEERYAVHIDVSLLK